MRTWASAQQAGLGGVWEEVPIYVTSTTEEHPTRYPTAPARCSPFSPYLSYRLKSYPFSSPVPDNVLREQSHPSL